MSGDVDQELLDQLRRGDSTAFNHVYNRYWQKLYVHAYKRIGVPELSEDLIQEIFVDFWLKRADTTISKSIESYLFGILKNKILMHFRELYSQTENQREYTAVLTEEDLQTEKSIDHRDLLNQVESLYESLPAQSRKIFELSRKEYLSNKEIAERLQISIKTVEYHISYSLNYLRSNCPDYILVSALFCLAAN